MTQTTTPPAEVAAIVRGLTKAQREAIIMRGARSIGVARLLLDMRLYGFFARQTGERWYSMREASHLGLAVRAALMEAGS